MTPDPHRHVIAHRLCESISVYRALGRTDKEIAERMGLPVAVIWIMGK